MSRLIAAAAYVLIVGGALWLSLPVGVITAGVLLIPFIDFEDL